MQQLLQMTHAQWAYRNATVHLEVREGQTAAAHETILETMEGFLHTDTEQLLKEHHHLLFSDVAALASGPIKDKLEWISEIDSALGAASHVARGSWHADQVLSRPPALCTDRVQVGSGGCRGEHEIRGGNHKKNH
jgi:hypothetical protein